MSRPTCPVFGLLELPVPQEGRREAVVAETRPNTGGVRRSSRVPRLAERIRVPIASLQVDPPEMGHPKIEYWVLEVDLAYW